jgi:3-methyl-2-oxobutanoate hydroxymethyltransferase
MKRLPEVSPVTVPALSAAKGRDKIAMLTAYDAPTAALMDEAGIDVLLVGDSLEMTVYGEPNTLTAKMDVLVRHTKAVSRSAKRALVVGDMPFLSYQTSPAEAVANAGRFLAEGGCAAVKVEGGRRILPAVLAILAADIPVMGHVGLTPQSYRKLGGYKVQGKNSDTAKEVFDDAAALAQAGCFAVVLEAVPRTLAAEITRALPIPTIGIGAGPDCDGQVLVFHDFVGLTRDLSPKFVRRYAELAPIIRDAAKAYAKDVREGSFPSDAESYVADGVPALRRVY